MYETGSRVKNTGIHPKILVPIGDGTAVLDTYYRPWADGYDVVVPGP